MDTAAKRFSAINLSSPWRSGAVVPDGSVDRQAVPYAYNGISWGGEPPTPPTPPKHGSGGRGKGRRGRTWGHIPDEDLPKRVQVLLEKSSNNQVTEYELVEWKDDPSWAEFAQAIQALQEEIGKHDGSSEKAQSLRAKIKRLKNKRNQRIIFMTLM